ncbi:hypothetical protein SK128_016994 [Halocaridina rubra]|uniref:Glycine-rich protein n=1 Tax=Halocaridina rubra TaxID=373956 RepID=A0AAN9AHH7_HALRR
MGYLSAMRILALLLVVCVSVVSSRPQLGEQNFFQNFIGGALGAVQGFMNPASLGSGLFGSFGGFGGNRHGNKQFVR